MVNQSELAGKSLLDTGARRLFWGETHFTSSWFALDASINECLINEVSIMKCIFMAFLLKWSSHLVMDWSVLIELLIHLLIKVYFHISLKMKCIFIPGFWLCFCWSYPHTLSLSSFKFTIIPRLAGGGLHLTQLPLGKNVSSHRALLLELRLSSNPVLVHREECFIIACLYS